MKMSLKTKNFLVLLWAFTIATFVLNISYKAYYKEYFFRYYSPSNEPVPQKIIFENKSQNSEIVKFTVNLPYRYSYFSQSFLTSQVEQSLREGGLTKQATVIFRDELYCFVDSLWFDKYALWWINFIKNNNVDFKQDSFDCDNYSDLFMAIYGLVSLNTTVRPYAQVACGTVVVQNVEEFAGIPALQDSWHSLNVVWTNNGWFIIEPQNGIYISLSSYPNKNNIRAIIF